MNSFVFESLVINNFCSFVGKHHFVLAREPGLYYIAGQNKAKPRLDSNGVGKTTLWDALSWCLEGETGRDKKPGDSVESWNAEGACFVALRFKQKGKRYILKRSRNPNALTIRRKGEVRPITQPEIDKLIGMSKEMFRRSVVLAQFGSLFLDLSPEQQSRMFNDALNLELWLRASKMAGECFKATKNLEFETRDQLTRVLGRIEELRKALRNEKAARDQYAQDHDSNIARVTKKIAAKEEEIQNLLRMETVSSTKHRLSRLANKSPQERRETIKGIISTLEDDIRKAGLEHNDLQNARTAARSSLLNLVDKKRQYDSGASGKTCPECGQAIDTGHAEARIAALDKQILKRKRQANALDASYDELESKTASFDKQIKKLRKIYETLLELESDKKILLREKAALEDQANPHAASVQDIRSSLHKARSDEEDTNNELYKLERISARCSFWITGYKEIRLRMIDQVLTELEMATTRHAEAMGLSDCRIEFQTERVKASGDVSVAFNTLLYLPEREKPVKWERYSGGESQRWQLAVAFGLSEVILARVGVSPNIEVLDEPTKGMSPRGVEELLEHLKARAVELNRAIYVTEHHSFERGLFDGVIMITRNKHGSQINEI